MKKTVSLILTIVLVMSLSLAVFASENASRCPRCGGRMEYAGNYDVESEVACKKVPGETDTRIQYFDAYECADCGYEKHTSAGTKTICNH